MAALTTDAPNSSDGSPTEPLYDQFFAGFVVKNLDTGESFHVDEIGSFLEKSKLLTFENASVSGWTVSIPELKEFAPRGLKPFVAYRIYITNPDPSLVDGRRTFSVFRRYSDFVKLDQALRGQTTHALPLELPAKKWFNNRDQQFVKERKEALQAYLNAVLHLVKPSDCEALESFFSTTTTDTSTKELSENQRFLTLEQATKEFGLIPPQKNNLAVVQ